ncbi:MAG: zinc dependent phospholipase C family protein [Flavobacteriales bacterium]
MKNILLILVGVFFFSFASEKVEYNHVCSNTWGFFGHKRINRIAVFTLPTEMFTFYKHHIEFLTENAVNPDKRRYAVEGEAERHYIDIDRYNKYGDPFEVVPRKWKDAVEKFGDSTLKANGTIPWHLEVMMNRLTKAFIDKDAERILRLSADLGHYVGDAHVPLHTTENYNGQLTGQKGIHGFWESRIPELFMDDDYDLFVGKAFYVDSPLDYAWNVVKESHNAVDSVLKFEKQLTIEYGEDKKFSYEQRGRVTMKVYSAEFSKAYERMLNNMQEKRMRASILTTGSFWYTAWVNAGKPNLNELLGKEDKDKLKQQTQEYDQFFNEGKGKGREHE